jgi:hypothetical protein
LGRPKIVSGSRSVVRQFVLERCEKRLLAHLPANSRFLNRAQPRDRPLIEKPNGEFPCFPQSLVQGDRRSVRLAGAVPQPHILRFCELNCRTACLL